MGEKIAIVTDSTAYLPQAVTEELEIYSVALSVTIDGKSYIEDKDIEEHSFNDLVKNAKAFPTTSQPAPGEFVSLYESLRDKGFDTIISIHLSSGISGTYQNAISAGELVSGVKVIAYDSEIACMAMGMMVEKAAHLAKDGATSDTILSNLDAMKQALDAYFIVDDLNHLARGGRLSNAQAIIGSLLQIKPILHFEDTKIVLFEKIRTQKKALRRIEVLLGEAVANQTAQQAHIVQGNCYEKAEAWQNELQKQYPTVDFKISYFGPVIATHLGEGALALVWTIK
ncbi:DegV family protein [Listeria booriae]|uniref:DegV family protein n=1 Tax=Listeria booriae TaxID=1552123 RepID=UPI00162993D4|nr:DegV family protein [Listeria booriae]MBC1891946.1 DegV family protein [Listeria booriae]MBC1913515.1 DegV family protein [Listeria booriae]MBC2057150.1 DegV family protein [Listeria booriae]